MHRLAVFVAVATLAAALQPVIVEAAPSVPKLFVDVPDAVTAASAVSLAAALPDVDVVKLSTGAPVFKQAGINKAMLASQPPRMQLELPNMRSPITVNLRRDLSTAPAPTGPAASRQASAAAAGFDDEVAAPGVYVGEVAGARGGLSSVVFVTAESGAVYGDIQLYDQRKRTMRSFTVVPEIDRNQVSAAAAAAAGEDATPGLYPLVNTHKYLIVEYNVPKGERRFLVPNLPAKADNDDRVSAAAAGGSAMQTVDTTPLVPVAPNTSEPLPGLDALARPFPTPEELDAAKAATAGPAVNETADGLLLAGNEAASNDTASSTAEAAEIDIAGRRKLLQSVIEQDVLIVYTAAAAARVGGVEAMIAKAQSNVARTNKAYSDSGINNMRLNLVAVRQIQGWSEGGATSSALGDLQAGRIPNVLNWRREASADLVVMFNDVAEPGICGWGYVGGGADYAFSEVLRGCFDGNTFAHELGHNQGCGQLSGDGSSARVGYAYGWRRCDRGNGNFNTIMAGGCSSGNSEVSMFATPLRNVNGVPAGEASRGDCARNIRETAATVAAYMPRTTAPASSILPAATILQQNRRAITLRNLNPNKCVDASSYNSGARVHVWDCHGGANQQWELLADGSVRIPGTNKCLDVAQVASNNGAAVIVWDCRGGNNQRWFMDAFSRLHPYHAPNMCLDVAGGNTNNGARMQIWQCNQYINNNQVFNAPSLATPFSSLDTRFGSWRRAIRSRLNNMCLDVFAYNFQNRGPVVMWPCNGEPNQAWSPDIEGAIRSSHNVNFCLDAPLSNTQGSIVYIHTCVSGSNQKFFMDPLGRLRPYSNINRCVDVRGANAAERTPIQLWECLDVPQQKWYI